MVTVLHQPTMMYERSLARLADWLDSLPAAAGTGRRVVAADARALDRLLADVWASGDDGGRRGLARGSAEQQRFREVVGPVLRESACMRHAIAKPRGYPGDFQMMQMLYDNVPVGSTPRGRWLDAWLLDLPYARAVRNRVAMMVGLLTEAWLAGRRRIGSIACGPARELAAVHRFLPFDSVVLLDQDPGALDAASREVGTARIRALNHPVRGLIDNRVQLDPALDLVYSMGLYDYLSTGTAAALTRRLWAALAPGGLLAIGNFADGDHPDQHLLEAGLDWYLRYRAEPEMLALVADLPDLDAAEVRTDPSGSLHLLVARRRAEPRYPASP
jgi:extracellular factor (EF) 3-hydroxypalmitic acid methyl ester biosynthesis protein